MLADVYIHVDVCMHVSVCNGWIDGRISLRRCVLLDLEVKEKVADPGDKRIKPDPCWENATSTESEALTSSCLASSFLDT